MTTPARRGGGVDIYQWLPFTQQDLTAASRATVAFAADYETYRYTEPAQAYIAKMTGVVTANFAASLQNSYATPGVAALRSAQKQVSTSSGGIASIRSFGTGDRLRSWSTSRSGWPPRRAQLEHHAVRGHGHLGRERLAGQRHRARQGG